MSVAHPRGPELESKSDDHFFFFFFEISRMSFNVKIYLVYSIILRVRSSPILHLVHT